MRKRILFHPHRERFGTEFSGLYNTKNIAAALFEIPLHYIHRDDLVVGLVSLLGPGGGVLQKIVILLSSKRQKKSFLVSWFCGIGKDLGWVAARIEFAFVITVDAFNSWGFM